MTEPLCPFTSQIQEIELHDLTIRGKLPLWLSGCFMSNGPAQFKIGSTVLKHWFDGPAMLKKFEFHSGRVSFKNRYLQSEYYLSSEAKQRLDYNAFGTAAYSSILGHIAYIVRSAFRTDLYDNCNVNICKLGKQYVALTESPTALRFNPKDLSTQSAFIWDDAIKGQLHLAHPHYDFAEQEMISVTLEMGVRNQYHIFKSKSPYLKRELIRTYVSQQAFYMHSFSLTPHYLILFKSPLLVNTKKMILKYPSNEGLSYDPQSPSAFVVIHRHTGQIIEIETEALICLHAANAYELNDHEIILDLVAHPLGQPYENFYLPPKFHMPNTVLKRYTLNLRAHREHHEVISNTALEFPTLYYRKHQGQDYQYLYSVIKKQPSDTYFTALQKIDLKTGISQSWSEENYLMGEPIFVPEPGAQKEDQGLILSLALDQKLHRSSLVVLQAESFELQAEIKLPIHLPLGLHGQFYPA